MYLLPTDCETVERTGFDILTVVLKNMKKGKELDGEPSILPNHLFSMYLK
jgi:hypothetical protein